MSYEKWISVNLKHSYFADGRCPLLRFEPTEDCRKQMRRSGRFFYPMPYGFIIFKDMTPIKKTQSNSEDSEENCFFDTAVYCTDKLFASYSNLEIDYRQGKVYYIGSPLKTDAYKSNEKRMTLVDRESGKEIEAVPVSLKSKQFVIYMDNAVPGDTFKLLDRSNVVVEQRIIKDKGSGASLYVDVSEKNAGIYRLEKNDKTTGYFYADDLLFRTKPAFIIGIEDVCRNYSIRVANRPVSWEYHVIARANGRKLKNLEIKNNNEKSLPGISFDQVRIDEDRSEAVFFSNQPVPLSEKAYLSVELIEKGNNGTPLIPHLANAAISSLHVNEGKWLSKIYVYI